MDTTQREEPGAPSDAGEEFEDRLARLAGADPAEAPGAADELTDELAALLEEGHGEDD